MLCVFDDHPFRVKYDQVICIADQVRGMVDCSVPFLVWECGFKGGFQLVQGHIRKQR